MEEKKSSPTPYIICLYYGPDMELVSGFYFFFKKNAANNIFKLAYIAHLFTHMLWVEHIHPFLFLFYHEANPLPTRSFDFDKDLKFDSNWVQMNTVIELV